MLFEQILLLVQKLRTCMHSSNFLLLSCRFVLNIVIDVT